MVCPYCQTNTKVKNSRPRQSSFSIWRRRFCPKCEIAFTTRETIITEFIINIKDAQGHLKPLNYTELYISVYKALEGLNKQAEIAQYLTETCLNKCLKSAQAVIDYNFYHKQIFETLNAYNKSVGQRYLLNEGISLNLNS